MGMRMAHVRVFLAGAVLILGSAILVGVSAAPAGAVAQSLRLTSTVGATCAKNGATGTRFMPAGNYADAGNNFPDNPVTNGPATVPVLSVCWQGPNNAPALVGGMATTGICWIVQIWPTGAGNAVGSPAANVGYNRAATCTVAAAAPVMANSGNPWSWTVGQVGAAGVDGTFDMNGPFNGVEYTASVRECPFLAPAVPAVGAACPNLRAANPVPSNSVIPMAAPGPGNLIAQNMMTNRVGNVVGPHVCFNAFRQAYRCLTLTYPLLGNAACPAAGAQCTWQGPAGSRYYMVRATDATTNGVIATETYKVGNANANGTATFPTVQGNNYNLTVAPLVKGVGNVELIGNSTVSNNFVG